MKLNRSVLLAPITTQKLNCSARSSGQRYLYSFCGVVPCQFPEHKLQPHSELVSASGSIVIGDKNSLIDAMRDKMWSVLAVCTVAKAQTRYSDFGLKGRSMFANIVASQEVGHPTERAQWPTCDSCNGERIPAVTSLMKHGLTGGVALRQAACTVTARATAASWH